MTQEQKAYLRSQNFYLALAIERIKIGAVTPVDAECDSVSQLLRWGFCWRQTEQGEIYWQRMEHDLSNNGL